MIAWADEITRFHGSISAKGGKHGGNGGFAEVSGKRKLDFSGKADLSAKRGAGGNLLLDPLNITITNTADSNTAGFTPPGDLTEAFADDSGLTSNFNVTAGTGSFAGIAAGSTITLQATNNITVSNAFNIATSTGSANNSLVLQANNNINVNAAVTASVIGSLSMTADADANNAGMLAVNAGLATGGGAIDLAGAAVTSNTTGNVNAGGGAVTINNSAGTSIFSKVIAGTGSLNKNGAGTLNLTDNNTYTGITNINAGTSGAIASTSAVNVAAGATFSVNTADIVGSLAGAGNASTTFSGVMSGTGNFTKQGTGTMTLAGANTYTGTTAVSAGTLVAANDTALGGVAGGTRVSNGASLALQGGINIGTEALNINGTGVSASGALRNLSGDNTYGGSVTLAGTSKIQSDAGILTFSAANSIKGTNRSLTLDGAGNTTFNGSITTGTGTITKNGTGTTTLGGSPTLILARPLLTAGS